MVPSTCLAFARVSAAVLTAAASVLVSPSADAQATLADSGRAVTTAFSYTGVLTGDVAGGTRRGATFGGAAAVQLTVLLERLVAWRGAQLFVFALDTHGGSPTDLVGAVQAVSGIEAPPALRFEEVWLQQNLLENRLSLLAGRYDLNTEFYRLQSTALFINSSFGIGPEFAQSGVAGPSTFPFTALGGRVAFKPSSNVVWRAAVLNGSPVDRQGGAVRLFAPGDGALLVAELALLDRPDTAALPRDRRFLIGRGPVRTYSRKVALGVWYYTARFPDLAQTLPSGAPVEHSGSRGAYAIADQTVWSAQPSPRALTVFAQLGVGDSRVNRVGRFVGGGLTLTAPIAARPSDAVGLATATAFIGSHYKRASKSAGTLNAETTVELTYLAQLDARLSVQPDIQYVIHPGATRATKNAVVPGFRFALTY
jgi:porin